MEGGGAGGLGSGPLLPLLTGREAPMRKLVPAHAQWIAHGNSNSHISNHASVMHQVLFKV